MSLPPTAGLASWAQLLILIGSLLILTAGAEVLLRGAAALAKKLGLSTFFIGLTIVGFGTSAPELATGIAAGLAEPPQTDINVGNIVGSNICNIALVLGLTAIICTIPIKLSLIRFDVIIGIVVAALGWFIFWTGSVVTRTECVIMLALLLIYLVRGYFVGKRDASAELLTERELESELGLKDTGWKASVWFNLVRVLVGLALLTVGSRYLVDSATNLATAIGVSPLVIALTVVAFGTSAPELFTCVVAARRGEPDIAVGNILGSNVFNLFFILPVAGLIQPQTARAQVVWLDMPLALFLAIAIFPLMLSKHKITRVEGVFLFTIYAVYTVGLFAGLGEWVEGLTASR